jgi:hypothetical protein
METIICFGIIAFKAGEIIIPVLALGLFVWNIKG